MSDQYIEIEGIEQEEGEDIEHQEQEKQHGEEREIKVEEEEEARSAFVPTLRMPYSDTTILDCNIRVPMRWKHILYS